MRDRIVEHPNRYKLQEVPGQEGVVDLIPMPGAVTDEGTFVSKATMLQDTTEELLFGRAQDRTVDQAFAGIGNRLAMIAKNQASITVTLKNTAGKPMRGVSLGEVYDETGALAVSDEQGVVRGYVTDGTYPLTVRGYTDIVDASTPAKTFSKGQTYKEALTLTTVNFKRWTASGSAKFSGNVKRLDITAVGGGGGGGGGTGSGMMGGSGGGGGGGYCTVRENVPFQIGKAYTAAVGAGGSDSQYNNGGSGGSSSLISVSAGGGSGGTAGDHTYGSAGADGGKGGRGGSGNGRGGNGKAIGNTCANGENGQDGSTYGYLTFTENVLYGGGGGGGGADKDNRTNVSYYSGPVQGGQGGRDYGGNSNRFDPEPGKDGFGGGGAAGCTAAYWNDGHQMFTGGRGAKGGSGCVAVRMHLWTA